MVESISSTVKSINQQMDGLLVMEMEFRDELQRWYTGLEDKATRWFRKARPSNTQYEITLDSQGGFIIEITNSQNKSD